MARVYNVNKYRNNYSYRNNYYNASNVAYDFEPEYYPDSRPLRKVDNINIKAIITARKELFLKRIRLIMSLFAVFAGCLSVMYIHVSIEEQRIVNSKLQTELAQLQSSNDMLTAEITEQLSLDYIEEQAKTRLGMAEPQVYQIEYIDVPKQSYTIQYEVENEGQDTETFDLGSILNVFKKD